MHKWALIPPLSHPLCLCSQKCWTISCFHSTALYSNLFNCLKFQKDGTNESFNAGMLTGSSNVASNDEGELQSGSTWTTPLTADATNCTGIGTPSEPPISGREEELAEVRRGKMPATVDNCAPPLLPIGGSQSSKFMASASQTACQSAFAGGSNWKMAQYAPKQHKDGTNESFDTGMLTGYLAGSSNVASNNEGELQSSSTWTMPLTAGAMNYTGIGAPSEPPISGREEELAEVQRGKMSATVDNCIPPLLPIGGSQSSKFMASASQTACQSDFADDGNWKMAQYAPKQHFEYKILRAFAMLPENIGRYKAFNEDYRRRYGASSKESGLFDYLTDDVVISILSKLSSSAGCPADFINVLMTCKRLNSLALDRLVLSKASSEMFRTKVDKWSESARGFMTLCVNAGNAQALSARAFLEVFA
ncbi:hypothetical protein SLE2022_397190 [Rubroshorea leprosula]